jgi:magnesium chelatase family protein
MRVATKEELMGDPEGDSSATVRERVARARDMQHARYGDHLTNASCSRRMFNKSLNLEPGGKALLGDAVDKFMLSGRGLIRTLRVARTLADLSGCATVTEEHVGNALGFRRRVPSLEEAA